MSVWAAQICQGEQRACNLAQSHFCIYVFLAVWSDCHILMGAKMQLNVGELWKGINGWPSLCKGFLCIGKVEDEAEFLRTIYKIGCPKQLGTKGLFCPHKNFGFDTEVLFEKWILLRANSCCNWSYVQEGRGCAIRIIFFGRGGGKCRAFLIAGPGHKDKA